MDKLKLEYAMKKKGISIKMLCQVLGISRSAYYRKVNSITEFTRAEIQTIINYVGLDTPMGIFFSDKVS
ncbi:MAG: helix-turn-helix domain-containing protein [Eubacteriales bacterium]|nr:helix-turn-helix domain-containing protein [Eubacteriales bacterium]